MLGRHFEIGSCTVYLDILRKRLCLPFQIRSKKAYRKRTGIALFYVQYLTDAAPLDNCPHFCSFVISYSTPPYNGDNQVA